MQVRMIVCQAGVEFVRNPGDVLEVPQAEALRMIEAGIAVPVALAKQERAVPPQSAREQRPAAAAVAKPVAKG